MTSKVKKTSGSSDLPGSDGISGYLIQPKQLKMYYMSNNYEFRSELFTLFDVFSRKLYLLIVNNSNQK